MNRKLMVPIVASSEAILPEYQTEGASGMDIASPISFSLKPMERKLVSTGLRIAVPPGFECQIRPRSGLALKKGISMVNSPGTIDSDYRGEVGVILINLGTDEVHIERGDRIGQMIFCPIIQASWCPVDDLDSTKRGDGGFGSTGRH